ncbi:MAG: TRAP transporter large permease subunit [Lachnospiraceae bacterium]|nr:TRAP transporter large permease subunit [Lachnospiraceae bacterium]
MSSGAIAGIFLAVFLILIFLGVPIYICMMSCGLVGCAILLKSFSAASSFLSDAFINTFTSYTVSVAPMFMLMGEIASESGIGANLFKSFKVVLGRIPGGMGSAVQISCAVFGAICGSAVATSGLMCRVAIPEMKKHGYSDELSSGAVGAGATLSTLIPPSLPLITYGASVQASIGQLFMGGIFTGIVLMLTFILIIQIWVRINPSAAPRGEKTTFKEKMKALKDGYVIEVVLVFAASFIGMFTGWFTPTEAGVVGIGILMTAVFGVAHIVE